MTKRKYKARKTMVDLILFDSKGEANRYRELLLLKKKKHIKDLKLQVRYDLIPAVYYVGEREIVPEPPAAHGILVIPSYFNLDKHGKCVQRGTWYVADFVYKEKKHGVWVGVVEDFKGYRTTAYKKKKNQMKIIYGVEIRES